MTSKMKSAFASALVALLMVASLALPCAPAFAEMDGTDDWLRVNDFTDSISDDDATDLSRAVKKEIPDLEFDFVVYVTSKTDDPATLAQNFFINEDYGYSSQEDGICLCLNPISGQAGVYVNGIGSDIFSAEDMQRLADLAVQESERSVYLACENFLNRAVNQVADYRDVDVSDTWPAIDGATEPADVDADPDASSAEEPDVAPVPAATHTTSELDWYPADPNAFQDFHNESAPRVVDNADILTDAEEAELATLIEDMRERLGMDFVFCSDVSSYGLGHAVYSADFFRFNGYGEGDDYSGVIYYVCMDPNDRGFWTTASGSARELMTKENVNYMDDATIDLFKSGDYGDAVLTQFHNLDTLYTDGKFPMDTTFIPGGILAALVAGLVGGGIRLSGKRKAMKTIEDAKYAHQYRTSLDYSIKNDRVTDTVVVRTPHAKDDDSSSGGSSFSSSFSGSGGGSYSGGGRSF